MATPAQWMNDLQHVLTSVEPASQPDMALFTLERLASQTLEADTLATQLAELGPVTGWLLEASAVRELHDEVIECQSLPLSGEWCQADQHWVLEHIHGRHWQLHCYRLSPATGDQASHLGIKRRQLKTDGQGYLSYWCLWQAEPPTKQDAEQQTQHAPEQQLALFAGFDEE